MPIYEYVLLALLASGDHRADAITLTLGPDAISQPKGGGLIQLADSKLKLNDIKGESVDVKHKDEIHIESFQSKTPLKNNPTLGPQNNMKMSPQNMKTK
jgi:hypothetical protein